MGVREGARRGLKGYVGGGGGLYVGRGGGGLVRWAGGLK